MTTSEAFRGLALLDVKVHMDRVIYDMIQVIMNDVAKDATEKWYANEYHNAMTEITKLLDVAREKALSLHGLIEIMRPSDRDTLFHRLAFFNKGIPFSIDGIADATAKFMLLGDKPEDL